MGGHACSLPTLLNTVRSHGMRISTARRSVLEALLAAERAADRGGARRRRRPRVDLPQPRDARVDRDRPPRPPRPRPRSLRAERPQRAAGRPARRCGRSTRCPPPALQAIRLAVRDAAGLRGRLHALPVRRALPGLPRHLSSLTGHVRRRDAPPVRLHGGGHDPEVAQVRRRRGPGEELVEIETDKANMTYEADEAGTLTIVAKEGDTLAVGETIARIGEGGGGGATAVERREANRGGRPEAEESEPEADEPSPRTRAEPSRGRPTRSPGDGARRPREGLPDRAPDGARARRRAGPTSRARARAGGSSRPTSRPPPRAATSPSRARAAPKDEAPGGAEASPPATARPAAARSRTALPACSAPSPAGWPSPRRPRPTS